MKRAFDVKQKAFFIIFKGLSLAKNCFRHENAPLKLYEDNRLVICWESKKEYALFRFKVGLSPSKKIFFYLLQ